MTNAPEVCYQVGFYEFTVELPESLNGYTVSYQRCCRIGGRRDCCDNAHGSRDLDQSTRQVFRDHADAARALQIAQQAKGLAMILADLVVDIADAGIGDCKLGKLAIARRLDDRPTGCGH